MFFSSPTFVWQCSCVAYAMMPASSAPATGSRRWHHHDTTAVTEITRSCGTDDRPDGSELEPGGRVGSAWSWRAGPAAAGSSSAPSDARAPEASGCAPLAVTEAARSCCTDDRPDRSRLELGGVAAAWSAWSWRAGAAGPAAAGSSSSKVHPRPRVHREPPGARPRPPLPLRSHWQAPWRPRFSQSQQPAPPPASRWLPGGTEPRVEVPRRAASFWRGAGRLLLPVRLAERAAAWL